MALNFTPLSAYKFEVNNGIRQRAENQAMAGAGLGAIAGLIKGVYDANRTKEFFDQFDDSEEIAELEGQIAENDEEIARLEKELSMMGVENGAE